MTIDHTLSCASYVLNAFKSQIIFIAVKCRHCKKKTHENTINQVNTCKYIRMLSSCITRRNLTHFLHLVIQSNLAAIGKHRLQLSSVGSCTPKAYTTIYEKEHQKRNKKSTAGLAATNIWNLPVIVYGFSSSS